MNVPLVKNTTRCSFEFVEEFQQQLSQSELKVCLTILRKTVGYEKKNDYISTTQFQDYTGVAAGTVSNGTNGLQEKGLIKITDQTGNLLSAKERRTASRLYYKPLIVADDDPTFFIPDGLFEKHLSKDWLTGSTLKLLLMILRLSNHGFDSSCLINHGELSNRLDLCSQAVSDAAEIAFKKELILPFFDGDKIKISKAVKKRKSQLSYIFNFHRFQPLESTIVSEMLSGKNELDGENCKSSEMNQESTEVKREKSTEVKVQERSNGVGNSNEIGKYKEYEQNKQEKTFNIKRLTPSESNNAEARECGIRENKEKGNPEQREKDHTKPVSGNAEFALKQMNDTTERPVPGKTELIQDPLTVECLETITLPEDQVDYSPGTPPYRMTVFFINKLKSHNWNTSTPNPYSQSQAEQEEFQDWVVEMDRLNRLGPPNLSNQTVNGGTTELGFDWHVIRELIRWLFDESTGDEEFSWCEQIKSTSGLRKKFHKVRKKMRCIEGRFPGERWGGDARVYSGDEIQFQAAEYLAKLIEEKNPRAVVPDFDNVKSDEVQSWCNEIDRLYRKGPPGGEEGKTGFDSWSYVKKLMDFAFETNDDFCWGNHIENPSYFRKKIIKIENCFNHEQEETQKSAEIKALNEIGKQSL